MPNSEQQASAQATSFDFTKMLEGMSAYIDNVHTYLNELESSTGGTVNLATMFNMQYYMQRLSQYLDAVSNTLTAVHSEMMTIARAIKGQ